MHSQNQIPRERLRRERGNTIVEFAISFWMIFYLMTGLFQFGYSFYAYNKLVNAVRNGARYGSNLPYSSTTLTPDSTYSTNVKNVVIYGTPSPAQGAQPTVSGLGTGNVTVTMTQAGGGGGALIAPGFVTVQIQNFTITNVFSAIQLTAAPYITFPYTGILTPPSS
jgi:Flp pilus assembly protein TadG